MSKSLTKSERYQFSLTGSEAKTVAAQRAAIQRCGLAEATPASVRKARQSAFAEFCEKQKDAKRLPAWVLAARFEASGDDWLHVYPGRAGRATDNSRLASLAYNVIDWGRLRKHSRGEATAFAPRVRTETNGKTGWDCVTWRYADYLCVLSPDGKKIAVQVDRQPVEVHAVFRHRFKFRGEVIALKFPTVTRFSPNARSQAALLRRHGFAARIVRQTPDMVSAGSGETLRTGGNLYCVVPDGLGGFYHVNDRQSADSVRQALVKRRIDRERTARAAELDALLASSAARIWVTIDDSIASGNCSAGTSAFVRELLAKIGADGEVGAVTAELLLSVRNDEYTRRAARVAALRAK